MKNEQEFLISMWSEISAKEWAASQNLVHEINRRLFIKEILGYLTVLVLFAAGGLLSFLTKDNSIVLYGIAILLFVAAFFAEGSYCTKSQGVSIDENRNYY